ncbi:MAG TPA: cytochrome b N-terminal domain-containing protein [Burkholderiales bacterium]|nr:cytochrome b N-terminal domain-containing protein [Burkholderiales bacterium]
MRHLGALGFLLFWMLAGSGIYLYLRFDTSASGAYTSIGELEWWFGGVLRSVHRYAADAFVLVMILHLAREMWLGRFRGWRAFTWISGIPLVWLLYASGLIGYWLVWDTRSQFSFLATMEWMGVAARVGEAPDRLFSLFVFLHIGLPLALLAGMWVHVQRLGRPKTAPPRALMWGCAALLLVTAALRPAVSEPKWDPARAARDIAVDWFYQFIHPLMYATSPDFLWAVALGATALLLLMPYASKTSHLVVAQVDPANCNACGRCVADCPYQAVILSENKAMVFAERCAACGICAGACPSSTPFRSIERLVSGIELPDRTMQELRAKVQAALPCPEMVFCCEKNPLAGAIALRCLAMLPPAVVEYALRRGARKVRAVGCEGECAYRLGMQLCEERFAGRREPHLRATVSVQRNNNEYRFVLDR